MYGERRGETPGYWPMTEALGAPYELHLCYGKSDDAQLACVFCTPLAPQLKQLQNVVAKAGRRHLLEAYVQEAPYPLEAQARRRRHAGAVPGGVPAAQRCALLRLCFFVCSMAGEAPHRSVWTSSFIEVYG